MKSKATIIFIRDANGEVICEVKNEQGEVLVSRSFGVMSEAEYLKKIKLLEKAHPDLGGISTIEIQGN
jgi:hypothetical protein